MPKERGGEEVVAAVAQQSIDVSEGEKRSPGWQSHGRRGRAGMAARQEL